MKNFIILLVAGMLYSCLNVLATGQQHTEKINKEFTVANVQSGTLYIYNIFGFLKIEGYQGNQVIVEAEKIILADDAQALETGKKEFQLGFGQSGDSIVAYIAQPFDSRPNRNMNRNIDIDYNYKVNYTVKVPYDLNLKISTVNNGFITVKDVSGEIIVNNVNDGISISNAKSATKAHTVNGDITINYLRNPTEACSYHTINGNIKVTYQPDLSADLQFKSMHGEFFTDFPEVETLPAVATKKQENNGGRMVYKLDRVNTIRFGRGGKLFKFETLNGNVYIKKQS